MKSRIKNYGIIGGLFVVLFYGALIGGEVLCIVKFFTSDFEPSYKRECIYGFSAITGLGTIVGWIDIEDTKPQTK
jgi:hypothetical protein